MSNLLVEDLCETYRVLKQMGYDRPEIKQAVDCIEQLENLFKRIDRMKPSVALDAISEIVRRIENNEELPE